MENIFNSAEDSKRPKCPSKAKGLKLEMTGMAREQDPEGGEVWEICSLNKEEACLDHLY